MHLFRLFNLTLPRLVEAATLCFSRIGRYAPPLVMAEWRALALLLGDCGPLSHARELHLDGHGAQFGDGVLPLFLPHLHNGTLPALEVLNLQESAISDEGLGKLIEALRTSGRALVKLDVRANPISDAGVRMLAAALADKSIRVKEALLVAGPQTSVEALEELVKAWKGDKASGGGVAEVGWVKPMTFEEPVTPRPEWGWAISPPGYTR